MARLEPAQSNKREPGGGPQQALRGKRGAERPQAKQAMRRAIRSSGVASNKATRPCHSQPRVKASAAPTVRASAMRTSHWGRSEFPSAARWRLPHQRQDETTDQIVACAARCKQQAALEACHCLANGKERTRTLAMAAGTAALPDWTARRNKVDCRSQSPIIAAVAPTSVQEAVQAPPSGGWRRSVRSRRGLVVGDGEDYRFIACAVALTDPPDIGHVGGDSVGEQYDFGSSLEAAGGFDRIADRDDGNAFGRATARTRRSMPPAAIDHTSTGAAPRAARQRA
jgi:hypothetical protein